MVHIMLKLKMEGKIKLQELGTLIHGIVQTHNINMYELKIYINSINVYKNYKHNINSINIMMYMLELR